MKKVLFIILITFVISFNSYGEYCKIRLPEHINNYMPQILPIISFDSKFLYFDRKSHPDNQGGLKDLDEIWFSELVNNQFLTIPKPLKNNVNNALPNVLFNISPDGKNTLIYGNYDSTFGEGYYFFDRIDNNFKNPKYQRIKNYENNSKNFFGTVNSNLNVMIITSINKYSYGGEDLFVTFKIDDNNWSEPINLGDKINTKYDEISPFIAYDNCHLYFASNRDGGFGEFDLYFSKRLDSTWTKWSEPINLGKFINTKFNETGFSTTKLSDTAFIISSEFKIFPSNNDIKLYDTVELKHGIYKICLPKNLQPYPYLILTGRFYEYKSDQLIPVKQSLLLDIDYENSFNNDYKYLFKNNDDNYVILIPTGESVRLSFKSKNYKDLEFNIKTDTLKKTQILEKNIILEPKLSNKPLLTLYFDMDIYELNLMQKQKIDFTLNKIDNKFTKKIKLIGFADEIGTFEYNDTLSYKRALEVRKYLVQLGFSGKNIEIIAKGEKEAFEQEQALNRKVEIYME